MTKLFSIVPALALVLATCGSASADMPSDATLADMGLAGIQILSDADGLMIRGKGYQGSHGYESKKNSDHVTWSSAWGKSWANIETDGPKAPEGEAGSHNGYKAEGEFAASGENYSEAGYVNSTTETVDIDGIVKSVTNTTSVKVFAGGFSSAMSF
jgi:hypothetical protein